MVAIGKCESCRAGYHEGHTKWVGPKPPEGCFGGMICRCDGECIESPADIDIMKYMRIYTEILKAIKLPGEEVKPTVTSTEASNANTAGLGTRET